MQSNITRRSLLAMAPLYGEYGYGGDAVLSEDEAMAPTTPSEVPDTIATVSPAMVPAIAVSTPEEDDTMVPSGGSIVMDSPVPPEAEEAPEPEAVPLEAAPEPEAAAELETTPEPSDVEEEDEEELTDYAFNTLLIGKPLPPANTEGGVGQRSTIPGCYIDHVDEGSPGCEQCQEGFFKMDPLGENAGDEKCLPCSFIPGCAFCNSGVGCGYCEPGWESIKGIMHYNNGDPFPNVMLC